MTRNQALTLLAAFVLGSGLARPAWALATADAVSEPAPAGTDHGQALAAPAVASTPVAAAPAAVAAVGPAAAAGPAAAPAGAPGVTAASENADSAATAADGADEEPSADAPDSEEIQQEIQAESAELQNFRRAETDAHVLEDLKPGDGAADEAARLGLESPLRLRLRDALRRQVWGGHHVAEPIPGLPEIDHDVAKLQAEYDIPIDVNEAVIAYVRFFQSPKVRPHFVRWLGRSYRYIPRYREIMKEEGLPEDTVYLAMIESGFSNMATSFARAVGPWQFIAPTGRLMGLDQDFWIDERRDPEKAARAAARFLKQMHDDFGDWRLAWAGYNAGPGKIIRAMKAGQKEFWDMCRGRILRPETKGYVPKLMAAAIIAKHPEAFGFTRDEIVPESWTTYEEVVVQRATELSAIAEAAGVPEKAILELNPELRRTVTPPRPYAIKIPAGQSDVFAKNWPEISARSSRFAITHHQVMRGESLKTIATAYGVAPTTLAKMNGLKPRRKPRPGSVLVVPLGMLARLDADKAAAATASATASLEEDLRPKTVHGKKAKATRLAKASRAKKGASSAVAVASRASAGRQTIKVRPGDTLWSIAQRFDVAVTELARWNGIRSPAKHKLRAGHRLIVYPNTGSNRVRPVASAE